MRVITGSAKGVKLKTPEGLTTRPTAERVKEALFSAIQNEIPGAVVLDLFGGTGQMGIEALSRGAKSAVFVDKSKAACQLIRENLTRTKLDKQGSVICGDYLSFLTSCKNRFDLILLDPPYAEVFLENALKRISEIDILTSHGIIIAERPFGKDLAAQFGCLSRCKEYKYGKTLIAVYRRAGEEDE